MNGIIDAVNERKNLFDRFAKFHFGTVRSALRASRTALLNVRLAPNILHHGVETEAVAA